MFLLIPKTYEGNEIALGGFPGLRGHPGPTIRPLISTCIVNAAVGGGASKWSIFCLFNSFESLSLTFNIINFIYHLAEFPQREADQKVGFGP